MATFKTTTDIHDPVFKEAAHIRSLVFVQEQGFEENEEADDIERGYKHIHVVGYIDDHPSTTARLLPTEDGQTYLIERVATVEEGRGQGLGEELFHFIESFAHERGIQELVLDAQDAALIFYEKLGYTIASPGFFEYGRPHHTMHKILREDPTNA